MRKPEIRSKAASVLLTANVKDALEQFAQDERRSKSSTMELAVMLFLKARGYLPEGVPVPQDRQMVA